jgi:hypothetical protein
LFGLVFNLLEKNFFPRITFLWLNLHTNVKPTKCPKSITNGHDGGIVDGDVDDAFVIDFVVVEIVVHLAHDIATIVLSYRVTFGCSKIIVIPYSGHVYIASIPFGHVSIAAIPYGHVFVAFGFMDQQKTTFAIASMDQENSMIHVLYICLCMHVNEAHGVICSFNVH